MNRIAPVLPDMDIGNEEYSIKSTGGKIKLKWLGSQCSSLTEIMMAVMESTSPWFDFAGDVIGKMEQAGMSCADMAAYCRWEIRTKKADISAICWLMARNKSVKDGIAEKFRHSPILRKVVGGASISNGVFLRAHERCRYSPDRESVIRRADKKIRGILDDYFLMDNTDDLVNSYPDLRDTINDIPVNSGFKILLDSLRRVVK